MRRVTKPVGFMGWKCLRTVGELGVTIPTALDEVGKGDLWPSGKNGD